MQISNGSTSVQTNGSDVVMTSDFGYVFLTFTSDLTLARQGFNLTIVFICEYGYDILINSYVFKCGELIRLTIIYNIHSACWNTNKCFVKKRIKSLLKWEWIHAFIVMTFVIILFYSSKWLWRIELSGRIKGTQHFW